MKQDKIKNRPKLNVILLHFIFWIVTGSLTFNYAIKEVELIDALLFVIYSTIIAAIPFYINYSFFSKYLFEKKRISVYFLLISVFTLILAAFINLTDYGYLIVEDGIYDQNLDLVVSLSYLFMISSFIRATEIWLNNKNRQQQIEKEKLQAELNFLRFQINPHFLFNILNNIYSLAYINGDKSAPLIAKLSQIMRYLVDDCKERKVAVTKEFEILKIFIDIHLLKIGQERNIDIYTEGITTNTKVIPLVFLTLLENSFKHGDITTNAKGYIAIECIIEDDILMFSIANSFSNSQLHDRTRSGIGLANIKKQLELNYSDKYTFIINDKNNEYKVQLKIVLE